MGYRLNHGSKSKQGEVGKVLPFCAYKVYSVKLDVHIFHGNNGAVLKLQELSNFCDAEGAVGAVEVFLCVCQQCRVLYGLSFFLKSVLS